MPSQPIPFKRLRSWDLPPFLLGVAATILFLALGATRSLGLALVIVLSGYLLVEPWLGIKPFGPTELLEWVLAPDTDSATMAGSSLVSLVAFLFAIWAASFTWRQGKRTELRLAAANEVHGFFESILREIITLEIWTEKLVEVHGRLQTSTSSREAAFDAAYIAANKDAIRSARDGIWDSAIQINQLRSKHGALLLDSWLANRQFGKAHTAVSLLSSSIYSLPPWHLDEPRFLAWISVQDANVWRAFAEDADACRDIVSSSSGFIKNLFESDVVKPAFSPIWEIWRLVRASKDKGSW